MMLPIAVRTFQSRFSPNSHSSTFSPAVRTTVQFPPLLRCILDMAQLFRIKPRSDRLVTKYEYDAFYRPTATILPMGQRNQTVYDKFGQIVSTKDFNGDTINYT
jgi:YD repeat-containing protein